MELGGGANQHGQDNMAQLEHHAHQGMLGWHLVCSGEASSGNLAREMGGALVGRMRNERHSLFGDEHSIKGGGRVGGVLECR